MTREQITLNVHQHDIEQPCPTDCPHHGTANDIAHRLDSRTYVVGLPVIIVVSPDGTVSVEVDMSEAGITMVKDENATDGTIPEHVMISDSEIVEAWRTRHSVSVMAR